LVKESTLEKKIQDGESVYIAPANSVIETCITQADIESRKKLAEALRESQQITAEYAELNKQYRTLTDKHESTLNDLVGLTNKYDAQISQYQDLIGDYTSLADRYDALVEGYRDVAINRASLFSFDAGAGSNSDGDVSGLLGLGWKRTKLWTVFQEDQTIYMLGVSIPIP
jgi:hypothetical protein